MLQETEYDNSPTHNISQRLLNVPDVSIDTQFNDTIEQRLRALPGYLQNASRDALIKELASIQIAMKAVTEQQNPLAWHQHRLTQQTQNLNVDENQTENEPLKDYSRSFIATPKQPTFSNFVKEFPSFHQSITRLLRTQNHQLKQQQEALQAVESWIKSYDRMRIQEMELLGKEIAIHTRLEQMKQQEHEHETNVSVPQPQFYDRVSEQESINLDASHFDYLADDLANLPTNSQLSRSQLSRPNTTMSDRTMNVFHHVKRHMDQPIIQTESRNLSQRLPLRQIKQEPKTISMTGELATIRANTKTITEKLQRRIEHPSEFQTPIRSRLQSNNDDSLYSFSMNRPFATLREQVKANAPLSVQKPSVSRTNELINIEDDNESIMSFSTNEEWIPCNLLAPNKYFQHCVENETDENAEDIIPLPAPTNHFGMMTPSHQQRELPNFDGSPDQDLLDWIDQFENAFHVSRHNYNKGSESLSNVMSHYLRSKLAEPAKSRVLTEIKDGQLDPYNYSHLLAVLNLLYLNSATAKVARAELSRLKQGQEN